MSTDKTTIKNESFHNMVDQGTEPQSPFKPSDPSDLVSEELQEINQESGAPPEILDTSEDLASETPAIPLATESTESKIEEEIPKEVKEGLEEPTHELESHPHEESVLDAPPHELLDSKEAQKPAPKVYKHKPLPDLASVFSKPTYQERALDYLLYSRRLFTAIAIVACFVGLYTGYMFFGATSLGVLWDLQAQKEALIKEVEERKLENARLQKKVLELQMLEPPE